MEQNNKKRFNIIDLIILIIIIIVGINFIFPSSNNNSNDNHESNKEITRTILVYMSPSDLESKHGLASNDLLSINKNQFDKEHNELIVMAGGSKKWHNSQFSKDPKIYHFNEDTGNYDIVNDPVGHYNMGKFETLTYFLDYVKENYESDEYILYFYGHGYGIDGALPDEVYNDNLSLKDMNAGITNSKFHLKGIKLDLIIINSCFMSTIETYENLSYHAKYAIATQESGWIFSNSPMFGFFNQIYNEDDIITIGKKYIEKYKQNVQSIYNTYVSMSLIDLKEIKNLFEIINNYFDTINVDNNYQIIKNLRKKINQIGNQKILDEVDLNKLMNTFSYQLGQTNYIDFTEQYNKTVLANYSNNISEYSGISIWFPDFDGSYDDYMFIGNEYLYDSDTGYRRFITKYLSKLKQEYGLKSYFNYY